MPCLKVGSQQQAVDAPCDMPLLRVIRIERSDLTKTPFARVLNILPRLQNQFAGSLSALEQPMRFGRL